jgi:membrane protein
MARSGEEPTILPPPRRNVFQSLLRAVERARTVRIQLERARERSPVLDVGFKTLERDSDIGGGILSGALAYRLFVFALPLSFFLVAAIGVAADLVGRSPESVGEDAGFAGAVSQQVATAAGSASNWWVALVSLAVLVYVTWVLLRALAIVHALAWERSAASVKVSMRSLAIFAAALVAQLALVGLVGRLREATEVGDVAAVPFFMVGVGAVWLAISTQLPHSQARWTDLLPGAGVYALGTLAVQIFSAYLLDRLVESKASTYGALGAAAAVLLGFFFIGRVAVASAVLNATLFEHRRRPKRTDSSARRAASIDHASPG